jgi:glycogen debranching enzyme
LTKSGSIENLIAVQQNDAFCNELEARCEKFRNALNAVNLPFYLKYDKDLEYIMQNLYYRMRRGKISSREPLFESYFTRVNCKDGQIVPLANNGWIWNGNPLIDFASERLESYYLRYSALFTFSSLTSLKRSHCMG